MLCLPEFSHAGGRLRPVAGAALALLLALAGPARAQSVFTSVTDITAPASHHPIIGLGQVGSSLWLFTTTEAYFSPLGAGTAFTQFDPSSYPLGIALKGTSFMAPNPSDDSLVYFTGRPVGTVQSLNQIKITLPTTWTFYVLTGLAAPPKGLAADPASSAVFYSDPTAGAGIVKVDPSTNSGAAVLTFGNSGPGALNTPGALAFGPDGLLYVLDTGDNRVVSFDTAGNYENAFALTGAAASTALAIDSRGFLYTADGNGGGSIYVTTTGQYFGSFSATATNADDGTGNVSLAVDDLNDLYLYDPATGFHVFDVSAIPEPASVAAWMAALAGGLACWRRRHGRLGR